MSYILFVQEKAKSLFERLDKLTLGKEKKGLFAFFVPIWQYSIYSAMVLYFVLTLFFQEDPFPYTVGVIKPFLVLLGEIFSPNGTHMNPILNRGLDSGGHILAYLSLTFLVIICRIKLPKTSEGFYFSLLIPAFALAVSEGLFNIFYWATNYHLWPHPSWFVFLLTNPLAAFYIFTVLISTILTPVWKFIPVERFYIALGFIMLYFGIWIWFGLPVTLSSIDYLRGFNLETIYYNSFPVNLIEVGQWVLALITFSFAVE